jgi:hypothetical protein
MQRSYTNLLLRGLLIPLIFCPFRPQVSGNEAEFDDDKLQAALAAASQNEQRLQSAIGVATFERWVQRPDEEQPTLMTTAKLKVYYDRGRYHVQMDVDHNMVRVVHRDANGQKSKPRLVDWKPETRYLISDGNDIYIVEFSERIHPTGCSGDIYPLDTPLQARMAWVTAGLDWQDPARLWKDCLDLNVLVKNIGRKSVLISSSDADGFTGKYPVGDAGAYAEFSVGFKQGNQVISRRVYSSKQKAPVRSHDLKWEEENGVWYVKSMTEVRDNRGMEQGTYIKSVITFESFQINNPVDQKLFALKSIPIPVGSRFINRSPEAKSRFRYFDGTRLGTTRVR